MKTTKRFFSILLSCLIIASSSSCGDGATQNSSDTSFISESLISQPITDTSFPIHNENADYHLNLKAVPSETEPGVINAVISLEHSHVDLMGIEFHLAFSSNTVDGIYTTNDEMAKTMTSVPMYDTTYGVPAPRYEQICVYDKASSIYKCMYVDLIKYPVAVEGTTMEPISGEFIITIPFKVNSDASAGDIVKFSFIDGTIKGTNMNYNSVVGEGNTIEYTLTEKDVAQ